jgi:hypothetical protein
MGIYPSDDIYGVRIYNFINDEGNVLFERKYDTIMSYETIQEAKLFYDELCETDKNNVFFKIYTECSTTYNSGLCMIWLPITLDLFIQKFSI